ncbi:hypothetical protein CIN01S_22_00050 [Chryseobacterium indologenes NBRC 14944]|nr:hypothetical protein CIN01S_22_00050 [Chryseobacterium indologenes NBRC 14944]
MAFKPNRFISTIFKSETFISLAGILAILFAVLCLSILIKNFFNRSFNLVIDKKGINDNSSFAGVGMILWEDIVSIKKTTVFSTKFLLIEVKNPDKYIRVDSKLKKRILENNLRTYGTPIAISANTLAFNFDKLEEVILKSFNEYKN